MSAELLLRFDVHPFTADDGLGLRAEREQGADECIGHLFGHGATIPRPLADLLAGKAGLSLATAGAHARML
ncbi:MAG TPA: hypothetical protein VLP43_02855 [Solirubrobacteraceae bacterium]|nr:hypothetical protein [Solirubrobacteraceae bacterium]